MITAYATREPFDPPQLYGDFLLREDDRSGTVVLHHGRVKRPGEQVPAFRWVELEPRVADVDTRLTDLAQAAQERYRLQSVLLIHRLGRVEAGGTVLLAIVSGSTRDRCFDACRFLVDEVKKEEVVGLTERP
ncbi:MAG: molybdenum cofactor biosynthesis protein MoaE [Deltaproteobacteria bacterium]|nr:molybdenum cofactor biosynthesis protein MoaE [Deltaproteobacteria bacterium]